MGGMGIGNSYFFLCDSASLRELDFDGSPKAAKRERKGTLGFSPPLLHGTQGTSDSADGKQHKSSRFGDGDDIKIKVDVIRVIIDPWANRHIDGVPYPQVSKRIRETYGGGSRDDIGLDQGIVHINAKVHGGTGVRKDPI